VPHDACRMPHASNPGMRTGKLVCYMRLIPRQAAWRSDKPQEQAPSSRSPRSGAARAEGRRAARPCAGP
jgi:hypothetical protein